MCSQSILCSDPAALRSQVSTHLSGSADRLLYSGVPSALTSPRLNLCLSPRSISRSATLAGYLS